MKQDFISALDLERRVMIKRILNFDKQDWKHCWWLFKNMIKQFVLMEFQEAEEAWLLLKLHLMYDSKRK